MTRYIDNLVASLKSLNAILGFKIEFEAEDASFEDLIILKQIGIHHSIHVFLKIGGVEAISEM